MSLAPPPRIPLAFSRVTPEEMRARAERLVARAATRRSVRDFSPEPIDLDVVRACIAAAALAPSGANKQPWTFVLVADTATKRAVRAAVEEIEREFYEERAPESWLRALRPFATTSEKPYLEVAPALVAVFAQLRRGNGTEPGTEKGYYVTESVSIAIGMLVGALHEVGLATLVHTPGPPRALSALLGRPDDERLVALLPVGLPAAGCTVPAITRRPLSEVLVER